MEYIEIICPICGRGMGKKATERIPTKPYITTTVNYVKWMNENYDMDKKIGIKRKTGYSGFGDIKRLKFKELEEDRKINFKNLCLKAIKFLLQKNIINKSDIKEII